MVQKKLVWLWVLFAVVVAVRLILALSVPNLTYDSYFTLRQVDHITQTGTPLYDDPLSYGGRSTLFTPFFHYVMAFFALFIPLEFVAKILPNFLFALLVPIVYHISHRITKHHAGSLFAAGVVGFLPVLYNTNSFTTQALFLPLAFFTLYSFLRVKEKRFLYLYIISFLALSLTSAETILLLMGFIIYIVLTLVEGRRVPRGELELILFSFFFFAWTQFLFFKQTFIENGLGFISQNIPSQIIMEYFPNISIGEALLLVSIIPFVAGIFVVYRSLFKVKNKGLFLLISFAVSTTLMVWFKLIQFRLSLEFFGVILAILFASFYKDIVLYIKQTKFPYARKIFTWGLLVVLIATMAYPAVTTSLQQEVPTSSEIQAFEWVETHTNHRDGVAAVLEEGHLITYHAQRENLMDSHFTLMGDVDARFAATQSLFTTTFQTQVIGLLSQYNIQYIVVTPHAREVYGIEELKYLSDTCFSLVYDHDTKIYKSLCALEVTE